MEKQAMFDLKALWGFCAGLIPGLYRRGAQDKNVEQIYSKGPVVYSPEKQKKLEMLCESLFSQKELMTTGRLQLIGLTKIKRKLGKTWAGMQPIVYGVVEDSISKYMTPRDIFIRYKDDSYVIIFADAGSEEAQIKATLIAEDIKRCLFDHEEEALQAIEVEEAVAVIKTDKLRGAGGLHKALDVVFQDIEEQKRDGSKKEKEPEKKSFVLPRAVEVDPYSDVQETVKPPDKPAPDGNPLSLRFSYVPLWDIKRNLLTTYLCVARKSLDESDPLDAHELVFQGASPSEKITIDLLVLRTVTKELEAMSRDGRRLFIACPVHYQTLSRAEGYEQYILECQKIPAEYKRYLIFLLLGLPKQVHAANIPKFSVPLKQHCYAIHAQVPLDSKVDFPLFRECRFEALGVRLKKVQGGEKQLIDQLNDFTGKAKKALIKKTFALDVASLSVTTSAVCADYDFLAGPAIHESVLKPDCVYRFKHESLFSELLQKTAKG